MNRIFVGSTLGPQLRDHIQRWQESYRDWPVRWTKPSDLHITLVPPWQSNDLENVRTQFQHLHLTAQPLTVQWHTITYGPPAAVPRMIWLNGDASPTVIALSQQLHNQLHQPSPTQAFRLHVTLARFTPAQRHHLAASLHEVVQWEQVITTVTLFLSQPPPTDTHYQPLAQLPLRATT